MYRYILTEGKITVHANEVYSLTVKIIATSEISEVSVNVYFVPEGQITYPPDITVGQILNVRNMALSFSGDHFDALLTAEE
jgi:hypothetical protein